MCVRKYACPVCSMYATTCKSHTLVKWQKKRLYIYTERVSEKTLNVNLIPKKIILVTTAEKTTSN